MGIFGKALMAATVDIGLCGVGPHREVFVRSAGSKESVFVTCDLATSRCSMTLFEQKPPLQFLVFLAMGDAPPEHWQTLESRIRGFVSENVVANADCSRWWPVRWMEG